MKAEESVYCKYLQKYIDGGYCFDMQMIANNFIKPSALPELSIDKEKFKLCCRDCEYCR